jgi:hypothetical protein
MMKSGLVTYVPISPGKFISQRSAEGLPEFVAAFIGEWFEAIVAGEFAEVTGDLEHIVARKPQSGQFANPGFLVWFNLGTVIKAWLPACEND